MYQQMLRTYFLVKAVSTWNCIKDLYQQTCQIISECYTDFCNYIKGSHHSWVFIKGHSLPLPLSHIKNDVQANWKYSNYTLTPVGLLSDTTCKLSWLSGKIVVINKKSGQEFEYDMDSFLHSFRLRTHTLVPTLDMVFLSWCAETRNWFQSDSIVQIHIFNDRGEEEMLTLRADNHSLVIQDGKLYHQLYYPDFKDIHNPYTYYHA
jgi:hypothetical protein